MKASTRNDGRLTVVGHPGADVGPVGEQAGDDVLDVAVVGGREGREADLVVTGAGEAVGHHRADLGGRTLADRAGEHPGLAEAAARGAATEDLDAEAVVDDLGERHELALRVGPGAEVVDRALVDGGRDVGKRGV